jgi:hypothetical protein
MRSNKEEALTETDEALKRSRMGREKGLFPAAFLISTRRKLDVSIVTMLARTSASCIELGTP